MAGAFRAGQTLIPFGGFTTVSELLGLLDGLELDLHGTAEGQRGDREGLAARHDLDVAEGETPAIVQEAEVLHVAGEHHRGAVDVAHVETAGLDQIEHLLEHLDDLLLGVAVRSLVLVHGHHAGEVEVVADLHAGRVGLTRGLHGLRAFGLHFEHRKNLQFEWTVMPAMQAGKDTIYYNMIDNMSIR